MRIDWILATSVALIGAMSATASAQTLIVHHDDDARVTARIGYGGQGVDVAAAIDSRRFGESIRFRGDLGHGTWQGINSRGDEPRVTRVGASALLFFPRPAYTELEAYGGVGIGAYLPHRAGMSPQLGLRLTLGMEVAGDPWTIGFEVELDAPDGDGPAALLPAGRWGIAVRRRF